MSRSDYQQMLTQKLNGLVEIGEELTNAILQLFTVKHFEKGHHFARAGEHSQNMGFVVDGILRAYHQTPSGDTYNKHFFTQGNFTGAYSSLVTGQKNLIDIECLTDVTLLQCHYADFTALYDEHREVERMARIIAEQYFVNKETREIQLVTLDASERYRLFREHYPDMEQRIPQYHIASYLGITPTQLSRIRAKQ
ncbi:Crp/Fnr family transcriptional regulator [Gracilimonas mengyeensis]|uniref:cAMP-binding domain of CRP or a regulatory subunit of cAMP-dependent protein kinases n=1 Tax=Gracilimonas mengyeensis TaxID=1302730 RepID=A0A521DRL9_9BACT|nr:Crp/Fnr family transcriptional regulator [Gracilimonas mengyeensis]SMO74356.1 cAMP-binding domain of CRP or a regulatory subunit of cAMP-dependent protein kinases [Gracilimonas mengyeensis]